MCVCVCGLGRGQEASTLSLQWYMRFGLCWNRFQVAEWAVGAETPPCWGKEESQPSCRVQGVPPPPILSLPTMMPFEFAWKRGHFVTWLLSLLVHLSGANIFLASFRCQLVTGSGRCPHAGGQNLAIAHTARWAREEPGPTTFPVAVERGLQVGGGCSQLFSHPLQWEVLHVAEGDEEGLECGGHTRA